QHLCKSIIGGDHVHIHFADRSNAFTRPPGIFLRRVGIRQPQESLLVIRHLVEKFQSRAGSRNGGRGRRFLSRLFLRPREHGKRKYKKTNQAKKTTQYAPPFARPMNTARLLYLKNRQSVSWKTRV